MEIHLHEPAGKSARDAAARRTAELHVQAVASWMEQAQLPAGQRMRILRALRERSAEKLQG